MKKIKLFALASTMFFLGVTAHAQYVTSEVFYEDMGAATGTTPIEENTFSNAGVTYTAIGGAEIRATSGSTATTATYYPKASGGANIFLKKDSTDTHGIVFGPINTLGFQNLSLGYGYRKASNEGTPSDLTIEYSTDSLTWAPITATKWERWKKGIEDTTYEAGVIADIPTTTSTGWYYITCDAKANTIPASNNLYIRIQKINIFCEVRIDDIVIKGEKPVPFLSITAPENGATYTPCDSVNLSFDIQNFNLYNSFTKNGDGYLKLESDIIDVIKALVPAPMSSMITNPLYCDATTMGLINALPKFVLPEGEYSLVASLVDVDKLSISDLSDTLAFSVVMPVVETPTFTPAAGAYYFPQTIELACATEDAQIYYTLDGSEPTDTTGTLYTEGIVINDTVTIKAVAYAECYKASEIAEATFTKDVTGIIDVNASAISIYPNPATNILNVNANGFKNIDIINFLGQVVYSTTVNNSTMQINVNNLNSGIYFVRLENSNTKVTKKFIKK